MTPAAIPHGHAKRLHAARATVLDAAHHRNPERFVLAAGAARAAHAAWINKPTEVAATQYSNASRLTGLDRLRPIKNSGLKESDAQPIFNRDDHIPTTSNPA